MILSKAFRNIRQKIEYAPASFSSSFWINWYSDSSNIRTDIDRIQSLGSAILRVTGKDYTDADWTTMLAAYGGGISLTQLRTWTTANRPDMDVIPTGFQFTDASSVRLVQEYDGRYVHLDLGAALPVNETAFFHRLILFIGNSASSVTTSAAVSNFIVLDNQDLTDMGIELIANTDGTYRFASDVSFLRFKISEDV